MKYLLGGVASVAALMIAAPVWAQNPSGGTGTPPAPAATSATPPVHHVMRHARAMHAFHRGMAHKAALSGDTTAQLNREELARIQSGGSPSPPLPPPSGPAPTGASENPSGGNSVGVPGPNPGGPGLTPYTH